MFRNSSTFLFAERLGYGYFLNNIMLAAGRVPPVPLASPKMLVLHFLWSWGFSRPVPDWAFAPHTLRFHEELIVVEFFYSTAKKTYEIIQL